MTSSSSAAKSPPTTGAARSPRETSPLRPNAFYLPKPYVDSAAYIDSKGRRWVMYEETKPLQIEIRPPQAIELDSLEELPDQSPSLRLMEQSVRFS